MLNVSKFNRARYGSINSLVWIRPVSTASPAPWPCLVFLPH